MGIGYFNSPEEVAARADAVTIHLALVPETKHLVGKKFLDAMKPGAILINTSRGPLVDAAALKAAIAEKHLRVGLDVFEGEPAGGEAPFADKELAAMITCTPAHRRLDRSSRRRHRRRNGADREGFPTNRHSTRRRELAREKILNIAVVQV